MLKEERKQELYRVCGKQQRNMQTQIVRLKQDHTSGNDVNQKSVKV